MSCSSSRSRTPPASRPPASWEISTATCRRRTPGRSWRSTTPSSGSRSPRSPHPPCGPTPNPKPGRGCFPERPRSPSRAYVTARESGRAGLSARRTTWPSPSSWFAGRRIRDPTCSGCRCSTSRWTDTVPVRKALIGLVLVGLVFGPAWCLLALGIVLNPAAQAACLPSSVAVEQTPDHLTARTSDGIAVTLDRAQLTRAATIVSVGAGTRGVGRDGILIALMAALTESHLRMLSNTSAYPDSASYPNDGNGGDHDSLGLFQMRPSTGWGAVADLMDSEYQAAAFYGGPTGPNAGSPRGLLDIQGWEQLPQGAAAQAVEASAYEDRYAAYDPVAEAIIGAIATGTSTSSCQAPSEAGAPLLAGFAGAFIASARTQLGRPYVWGGGAYSGPSGIGSDGRGPGLDCSGLVLYAAYQASNGTLRLPHYSGAQITFGHEIAWDDKQPGDLVFFTHPGASAPHHVAIYLGGNSILQAPHTGDHVRVGTIAEFAGEVMTVRRLGG